MKRLFIFKIKQEIALVDKQIERLSEDLDEKFVGKTYKRRRNGKLEYFCYRRMDIEPKRLYLGHSNSRRYREHVKSMRLNRKVQALKNRRDVLENSLKHFLQLESEDGADVIIEGTKAYERYMDLVQWAEQEYEKNEMKMPERAVFTSSGLQVRSKDEELIAEGLTARGIPYRYEPIVRFKDALGRTAKLSPDYLIQCFDGSYVIIEHFGLLNEDWYSNAAGNKLHIYTINGYIMHSNLFLTSGDGKGGIDMRYINVILDLVEERFWE